MNPICRPRNLLFLFLSVYCQVSRAQVPGTQGAKDSTAAKTVSGGEAGSNKEKDHLILGVTYHSDMNYYGRVDSLKTRGIYPFIGFTLGNGLYLVSNFVFIRNDLQSQYAATLLEGGYNFKNKKGSWTGNLSAIKYFYKDNVDLVQSAIRESFSASVTNLNKVINITVGANVKISDKADFGAQGGLDHIFRIPRIFCGKDVIVLDPSVNGYAGTQNFTRTWYQQKNFLGFPAGQEQVTASSQEFNILAYEFSMPIIYGYKSLNLIFSPAYIIPQNIIKVPDQPALSERGSNMFYFTATVKFTL